MKIVKYISFYCAIVSLNVLSMEHKSMQQKKGLEVEPRTIQHRIRDVEEELFTQLVNERLNLQRKFSKHKREAQEIEIQIHEIEKRLIAKAPLWNKNQAKL